ncbi:cupin domain-containing protein [Salmonella enterica]|uniref:Cupin domain-containing protein n=1 Tax=Salmonella enterica subsp. enterica serovar Dessau TaxID=2564349 RepID=A0A8E5INB2_SALET|nr:cupin domain-containing protein [Salmonella enterica]QUS47092.1 cupin domain-containing protein [Salmonella enterica subsp. enterica serovar Dessau]
MKAIKTSEVDMIPRLYKDGGMQMNTSVDFFILQGSCVGGSTTVSNMVLIRAADEAFARWAQLGAALPVEQLHDCYDRIERTLEAGIAEPSSASRSTQLFETPAHRHTQSALRFVLEGKGAYTAVDGERTAMAPGDFVITPSMTWHDHSNETSEPMFWLDGLDIPMVQFFDCSFAEGAKEDQQAISKPAGDTFARYGRNLLPIDQKRSSKTSPIFNVPKPQQDN